MHCVHGGLTGLETMFIAGVAGNFFGCLGGFIGSTYAPPKGDMFIDFRPVAGLIFGGHVGAVLGLTLGAAAASLGFTSITASLACASLAGLTVGVFSAKG